MKRSKYRLVKVTYASGYIQWNIQKKVLWWWEWITGGWDEGKVRREFEALQKGTPFKRQEVMPHPAVEEEEACPF